MESPRWPFVPIRYKNFTSQLGGSEWGLVLVLLPMFLVFIFKLAIFLMFTVLEKKYCLVFERRPQSLFSISNVICPFKFCKKIKKISREQ